MAETLELPTLDRYVLFRTWEDLTDEEQGQFNGYATAAADAMSVASEKECIDDLMEIILFGEDYADLRELSAGDGGVGKLTVAEAWSILVQVPPEGSATRDRIEEIDCISPKGDA